MNRLALSVLLLIGLLLRGEEIVATVDDVKITREEFLSRLMEWAGKPVLREMIDTILVEREAEKEGIKVSPQEVQMRVEAFRRISVPPGVDFEKDLLENGTTLARITNNFRLGILLEKIIAKQDNFTVSKEEIEAEFKKISKERKVRMILVKSEDDLITVQAKLKEGAFSFAELAEKYSIDEASKAKGGDIGYIRRGMLPPYLEEVIFGLKVGGVSEPIWTKYGFYFFKVEEERNAELTPQLRAELEQMILSAKVGLRRFQVMEELRSKAKISEFL